MTGRKGSVSVVAGVVGMWVTGCLMELWETLFAGRGKAVLTFPCAVNGVFHSAIACYPHFHDARNTDSLNAHLRPLLHIVSAVGVHKTPDKGCFRASSRCASATSSRIVHASRCCSFFFLIRLFISCVLLQIRFVDFVVVKNGVRLHDYRASLPF